MDDPKTAAEALRVARTAVVRMAFGNPDNCNDQTFPPLVDALIEAARLESLPPVELTEEERGQHTDEHCVGCDGWKCKGIEPSVAIDVVTKAGFTITRVRS